MRKVFGLFVLVVLLATLSFSQSTSKNITFRAPVDFPMRLSGTFGELRSGHFHAGIDIKTYEQTGKVVRMIDDGHISRIKIRAGGYGKAIYVTHNNGYTSVFAHLKTFNRTINKYIRKLQLKKESYEIDVAVPKYRLYYKKGDIIAYTGNSGYSMGPHLHFEIRETRNQRPVNPLYFGFDIKDDIPPALLGLKVYQNENAFADSSQKEYELEGQSGKYKLKSKSDTLKVKGKVSFGISAIDKLNDTPNPDGVYKIRLLKNDTAVFTWTADRFSFYETRYINSLIDYGEYQDTKRRFVRSEIDPYNKLSMYERVRNQGLYSISKDSVAHFHYQVSDYFGNTSEIDFYVKNVDNQTRECLTISSNSDSVIINPSKGKMIKIGDLSVKFPKHAFYRETIFFAEKHLPDSIKPFPLFHLGDRKEPVHKYFTIKTDAHSVNDSLLNKALWGRYDKEDGFEAVKSKKSKGALIGTIRKFGMYGIKIDTVPPIVDIQNLNKNDTISLKKEDAFRFKMKDHLSGIADYDLYLNNNWVIGEYDAKNDLLIYRFDEFLKKGKNTLKLEVKDEKDNVSVKTYDFVIKN